MTVYQTYIAINVNNLLLNPPQIKNQILQNIYIYFKINAKIILSIFMIAIALGGCGIWGMHFLGMHALRLYIVPKNVTSSLPIFDPYTEEISQNYFLIIPLYYEIWTTVASLLIAVLAVFIGMLISAYAAGMIYVRSDSHKMSAILAAHSAKVGTSSHAQHSGAHSVSQRAVASHIMDSMKINPMASVHNASNATSPAGSPEKLIPPASQTPAPTTENNSEGYININKINFFQLSMVRKAYFMLGCSITGLGAAAMHYCGVASIRIPGVSLSHRSEIVALAVIIGLVVAIAGLWILFFLRGWVFRLMAPLVIGAAVFSLHYVGMYGTSFSITSDPMVMDHHVFLKSNPTVIGGLLIEIVRAQVNFSLELIILAVGFHLLNAH
ncbi:hypothetical protein QVD99_008204 [Batrachochytrium dendrobatidis]|nr:hypothetical protein QVD99_008204 [Batrachochytrium dendrobatidis]